jgi:hypothetical protein
MRMTGDTTQTLRLAASLEELAAALHRAPLPPPERPSAVDGGVAGAHLSAVREAAGAFAALGDGLLTDADRLYLVAAAHRRAEEQSAAALGLLREPARPRGVW